MESFDSNQNLSSSKYRRILLPISFLLGLQGYLFLKVNSISFFQLEEEKWDHPTQEQQKQPQQHQHHHHQQQQFPVIDILSIGSETRLEYLQAQRETFASHRAVRNFFFVTERNDTDPTCSKLLSPEDVYRIAGFCKGRRSIHRASYLMRYLRNGYASKKWLMKKKSPVGWVCAQTRPAQGMHRVQEYYKHHKQEFPDYLLLLDDDTYFNIALFIQEFKRHDSANATAVAGCKLRSPIHVINWTIPHGGFGTIFSKGWLRNFNRPIQCPRDHDLCRRIQQDNLIGERLVFRDGMTIADLMYAYATYQPYREYNNWTLGFCLHSDWLTGYITNFYNVSDHLTDNPYFKYVPQERLNAYFDSGIYSKPTGNCKFELSEKNKNCPPNAPVCHYTKPTKMAEMTNTVRTSYPGQFR